jgi:hypothetical protein
MLWSESLKARDQLEDQGIDGRIPSNWIANSGRVWTGFIWLMIGIFGTLL